MAITKTRSVFRVDVFPPADSSLAASTNDANETIQIVYQNLFEDSSDSDLPITTTDSKFITRYVSDGGSATDYSGEDTLVRTIADAIWS